MHVSIPIDQEGVSNKEGDFCLIGCLFTYIGSLNMINQDQKQEAQLILVFFFKVAV